MTSLSFFHFIDTRTKESLYMILSSNLIIVFSFASLFFHLHRLIIFQQQHQLRQLSLHLSAASGCCVVCWWWGWQWNDKNALSWHSFCWFWCVCVCLCVWPASLFLSYAADLSCSFLRAEASAAVALVSSHSHSHKHSDDAAINTAVKYVVWLPSPTTLTPLARWWI